MKSEKFIQLFDENQKPILSSQGILNYDKRSKTPEQVIKQLRGAKKLPEGAKYLAIHKTLLNTIVKLTGLTEINDIS